MKNSAVFNFRPTNCVPLTHKKRYKITEVIDVRGEEYFILIDDDKKTTAVMKRFLSNIK